ncbi:hypothetical protein [Novosphingobium album (ex Liu et al. 2023)]|uniref:DUF4864 domain-containing protein n=1 Tax=Novosphingobium album (ex Liu et al. 2023) TaxID=3031130 RepID=A0ABT5WWS4_9SPHN|nr:hypothetical protein [Novosphingobium album (ex Liu et al. 2023)]MDE8654361.1 hypothetical protein [Novosphingobium album (ex Liu et al. 2023)]
MKKRWAWALALSCVAAPASAQTALSAADNAQIDALVQPMIDGLIAGKAKDAISTLLNRSDMMRSKPTDVGFLGVQAEAAMTAYGPIRACELVEQQNTGHWAAARLYICQHDRFLTRWIVAVFKSPSGWQPSNLRFDDKFSAKLEE